MSNMKFYRGDGQVVEIEDFTSPKELDMRGTFIETLPEGKMLSDLDDLEYFQRKIYTSLAIPKSYLMNSENPGPPPAFRTLITREELHAIWVVQDFDRAMKVVSR
jgi:hypothetical protein